jgi:CRISPR-associated endonuclease Csn1
LHQNKITPGQYAFTLFQNDKVNIPNFLSFQIWKNEFELIWNEQAKHYPEVFTPELRQKISGQGKTITATIIRKTANIETADLKGLSRLDRKKIPYEWRSKGVEGQLPLEQAAYIIADINGEINSSSGYLSEISDRSKELFFNKETVGQYLYKQISNDRHTKLKGQVFYRQDYLDEFEAIWAEQSKHYPELNEAAKETLRDIIIFHQRRLKSQKGLISICELEGKEMQVKTKSGKVKHKVVGPRVAPKSSPIFQEFRIWQSINNIKVTDVKKGVSWFLEEEARQMLFQELSLKSGIKAKDLLKLLYSNYKDLEIRFDEIKGNQTNAKLFKAFQNIVELSGHGEYDFDKIPSSEVKVIVKDVFSALNYDVRILDFDSSLEGKDLENQPSYQLWHLLYSFEGDDSLSGDKSLVNKLIEKFGFDEEAAKIVASATFEDDYGSLSVRAMRRIIPFMQKGLEYSDAAKQAGYNHSSSLTKQENDKRVLEDYLRLLPKNSLRNPVVEKILNQMVNVVNALIEEYGKPDEIRLELARELKKSAKERADMTKSINDAKAKHEKIRDVLKKEFGLSYVSRNDIIRYKLYKELEPRGFKTLYTNTYIPPNKLFSSEIDIEHIIPQAVLFDDSFTNKTLEYRDTNREKGNMTAFDFVQEKYGSKEKEEYEKRVWDAYKGQSRDYPFSRAKVNKLLMPFDKIPDGFIERDLRNSQYIAKKAREILETIVRTVNTTTGSITDRLRADWQLIDVMQEINWPKYEKLGLTYYVENKEGKRLPRIKDWTKRDDHRHHAMDAITVAFTKYSHVQYLNNLNARKDENHKQSAVIKAIEAKELYRDEKGKLRFKPPMPLTEFRKQAKMHLENTLVSFKAKNKVVTPNANRTKKKGKNAFNEQSTLTPRGKLHNETIYGSIKQYETKEVKVGTGLDLETINKVAKKKHREALLKRLKDFAGDPKKAFGGKNSPTKNPIFLDELHTQRLPEKVKLVEEVTVYTIRKAISPDLKIDKVIDKRAKEILQKRLDEFGGNVKEAFSNLEKYPIYLDEKAGIQLKSVTIRGVANAIPLHEKRDHTGKLISNASGETIPVDFVNPSNNHHVAIYKDEKGNLQEKVVSFFEAVERASQKLPIVDKSYNAENGWQFQFTMKQNEYFVFPNEETGFDPSTIDFSENSCSKEISNNLYRVQKFGSLSSGFWFRHHLETNVEVNNVLKGVSYKVIQSVKNLSNVVKVRLNHTGRIEKLNYD